MIKINCFRSFREKLYQINYYSLLLLFILSMYSASAQDMRAIDSLNQVLIKQKAAKIEFGKSTNISIDTLTANTLNALCKAWWFANPDTAMYYAKQTLEISQKSNFKTGMGNAYNNIGSLLAMSGQYEPAMNAFEKSLSCRRETGDKKGMGTTLTNIGNVYNYQGNYTAALKLYFETLKLFEEIGDKTGQARSLSNIGSIYIEQDNYSEASGAEQKKSFEMALSYTTQALKIRTDIGDSAGMAVSYNNIGSIYRLHNILDKATENYMASLRIKEALNDRRGLGLCFQNLGSIESLKGNFSQAEKYFDKAIRYYEEANDIKDIGSTYGEMGLSLFRQKKYREASAFYNKALSVSKPINDLETMKSVYEGLYKIDSIQNNNADQLQHYKAYIAVRDSSISGRKSRQLAQLQLEYEFRRKQFSDSLLFAKGKEVTELRLQKQKSITNIVLAGISIALLLLFLVYYNYRKQRTANRQLREAQQELIRREKMAAFGVMASRVAHEIQNPLNFVNNFSELSQEVVHDLIQEQKDDNKNQHAEILISNLKKINEHGKRAAQIVKQLNEHSNKGTAQEFFEEK